MKGYPEEVGRKKVVELMTRYVLMVEPDVSVLDAMRLMCEKNFRCVIIARKHPYEELGLVTRFDIMKKVLGKKLDPHRIRIIDIMEKKMICIDAGGSVAEASRLMGENEICHLPVRRGKEIIGIISSSDIFRAYLAAAKKTACK